MDYSVKSIGKSWILAAQSNQSSNTYKENEWAIDRMMDLPDSDPEKAWNVIMEVFTSSKNPKVLSYLAAGPLEQLMCSYGTKYIDGVREFAINNMLFVELMKDVRLSSEDTTVYLDFYKIAGIEPPLE